MLLNSSDFYRIQKLLTESKEYALKYRKQLSLTDLSIKDKEFFINQIVDRILGLGFSIKFTEKLNLTGEYGHVPSIILYNSHDKKQGGRIFVYEKYTSRKKLELLVHELIHILDIVCSLSTTMNEDGVNKYMILETTLEQVEERTELISLAFMMPMDQFYSDLFGCLYNINDIVNLYGAIKASSIIKWMLLNDYFHAHYALLYIKNEDKDNPEAINIVDAYRHDSNTFDINNILSNKSSIAFKSKKEKVPKSGESLIDDKYYQCFCFYEEDVYQSFPIDGSSSKEVTQCDEMVIVGWSKDTYLFIQKLKYQGDTPEKKVA